MPIANPASLSTLLAANVQSDFPLLQPGGRLTLTRSNSEGDATDATQLFYVPHIHPFVPVWNNQAGAWINLRLADDGLLLGSFGSPNGNFDIYATGSLSTQLTVTSQGWSSDSARFRPVVMNGLRCVDFGEGTTNRYSTYLGTIRTSGTSGAVRLQDDSLRRHIWNNYNRVDKPVQVLENAASWQYSVSASRVLNNNPANRIEMLAGLSGGRIHIDGRFSALAQAGRTVVFAQDLNGGFDLASQVVLNDSATGENSATNQLIGRAIAGLNTVRPFENVFGGQPLTIYGFGRAGLRGFWSC